MSDWHAEAARILEFLASSPVHGHTMCRAPVLREVLLTSGGTLLAQGQAWTVQVEHLGAGVYDVRLQEAR